MLNQQNRSFYVTNPGKRLNEWLKEIRKLHGISLLEMSRYASVSSTKLRNMETGKTKVKIHILVAYCHYMGIAIEQWPFFDYDIFEVGNPPVLNEQTSIIREYRKRRGLSLRKLAERMGRNHMYLYRIENRYTRSVAVEPLVKIDQLLEANGNILQSYWNWEYKQLAVKERGTTLQVGGQPISIPESMKVVGPRGHYWQTTLAPILWCVAVLGFSTIDAFDWKLNCEKEKLNRGLNRLVERGFLTKESTTILNTVNLYSLTDTGKIFCKDELGWEVIESDFERMIRLHQGDKHLRHTALCLEFATKARKAGYQVELVPEVAYRRMDDIALLNQEPDVLIWNNREFFYVEVEMRARSKKEKWENQEKLQGDVVFYSATTSYKNSISKEIAKLGVRNVYGLGSIIPRGGKNDLLKS